MRFLRRFVIWPIYRYYLVYFVILAKLLIPNSFFFTITSHSLGPADFYTHWTQHPSQFVHYAHPLLILQGDTHNNFSLLFGRKTKAFSFLWLNNFKIPHPKTSNFHGIKVPSTWPKVAAMKPQILGKQMPKKSKCRVLVQLWRCHGGGTWVKARGLKNRNPFKQRVVNRPLMFGYITKGYNMSLYKKN